MRATPLQPNKVPHRHRILDYDKVMYKLSRKVLLAGMCVPE